MSDFIHELKHDHRVIQQVAAGMSAVADLLDSGKQVDPSVLTIVAARATISPMIRGVEQVREKYAFSERRACRLIMLAVTTYRYRSRRTDEPLRTKLVELAREKPRFGYRRLHVQLCGLFELSRM